MILLSFLIAMTPLAILDDPGCPWLPLDAEIQDIKSEFLCDK
jgi:hypothetical protein